MFFATLAPSQADSAVVKFMADCKELGIEVPGLFPATGADTVKAVAWAIKQSGSMDPATIADTIRSAESIPVMSVDRISFK